MPSQAVGGGAEGRKAFSQHKNVASIRGRSVAFPTILDLLQQCGPKLKIMKKESFSPSIQRDAVCPLPQSTQDGEISPSSFWSSASPCGPTCLGTSCCFLRVLQAAASSSASWASDVLRLKQRIGSGKRMFSEPKRKRYRPKKEPGRDSKRGNNSCIGGARGLRLEWGLGVHESFTVSVEGVSHHGSTGIAKVRCVLVITWKCDTLVSKSQPLPGLYQGNWGIEVRSPLVL